MSIKLQKGHRKVGRWIYAPVKDVTTPKAGRVCHAPAWWAVTENDEVLFFDYYFSPQCNVNQKIAERLGTGFDAPKTTPKLLGITFLPADH